MIGKLRFFLNIFKFYSIFLLGWATGRRLGTNIVGMGYCARFYQPKLKNFAGHWAKPTLLPSGQPPKRYQRNTKSPNSVCRCGPGTFGDIFCALYLWLFGRVSFFNRATNPDMMFSTQNWFRAVCLIALSLSALAQDQKDPIINPKKWDSVPAQRSRQPLCQTHFCQPNVGALEPGQSRNHGFWHSQRSNF